MSAVDAATTAKQFRDFNTFYKLKAQVLTITDEGVIQELTHKLAEYATPESLAEMLRIPIQDCNRVTKIIQGVLREKNVLRSAHIDSMVSATPSGYDRDVSRLVASYATPVRPPLSDNDIMLLLRKYLTRIGTGVVGIISVAVNWPHQEKHSMMCVRSSDSAQLCLVRCAANSDQIIEITNSRQPEQFAAFLQTHIAPKVRKTPEYINGAVISIPSSELPLIKRVLKTICEAFPAA